MLLPQTAEYALRAVTVLAKMEDGEPVSAIQISKKADIPLPYLSKILRHLVTAKILTAKKGPNGGFTFAKPLEKITFFAVLEAAGFKINSNHCVFGWTQCNSANPCPLHNSFKRFKRFYLDWGKDSTLADVVK